MAYIGNVPAEQYATLAKQTITGNGGASYTLDYAVANEQEIEVFVNNVRQEPGVAYTVSGTALTMTGNVTSTDDFYVVFQGKSVGTINPPDNSVGTAQLVDDSVTTDKIATGAVTPTALSQKYGLVHIATLERTSAETSTSPYMDVANCFTSDYNNYVIFFDFKKPNTTQTAWNFALDTSGSNLDTNQQFTTTTWLSTFRSTMRYFQLGNNATSGFHDDVNTNYCYIHGTDSTADSSVTGQLFLYNVRSGKRYNWRSAGTMYRLATDDVAYFEECHGMHTASTCDSLVNCTGIRFFTSSVRGDSTSIGPVYGTISIYGVND